MARVSWGWRDFAFAPLVECPLVSNGSTSSTAALPVLSAPSFPSEHNIHLVSPAVQWGGGGGLWLLLWGQRLNYIVQGLRGTCLLISSVGDPCKLKRSIYKIKCNYTWGERRGKVAISGGEDTWKHQNILGFWFATVVILFAIDN